MKEKERQKNIGDLKNTLEEIIKISSQHKFLFEDSNLWPQDKREIKKIYLFQGFHEMDEMFHLYLRKDDFRLYGINFVSGGLRKNGPMEPELVARTMADNYSRYRINSEWLMESFISEFKIPLGNYLAQKYLERHMGGKNEIRLE